MNIKNAIRKAEILFENERYNLAHEILIKIIESQPLNSRALEILGYIYGNQNKLDIAHNYLLMACQGDKPSPSAYYYLGTSFLRLGNYIEAKKAYKVALEKSGDFYEGLYDIGVVYENLGDLNLALIFYLKAFNIRNTDYQLAFKIARIYFDQGEELKSLEYLKKSTILNDNFLDGWIALAKIYEKLSNYHEAINSYKTAIKLDNSCLMAWEGLAKIFHNSKEYEESLSCYQKILSLTENNLNALNEQGRILIDMNQPESALSHYELLIKSFPRNTEFIYNKAVALTKLNKYKESIEEFKKVLSIDDRYVNAWNGLAYSLSGLGSRQEALKAYNTTIDLKPDFVDALANRAILNLGFKNYLIGFKDYKYRLNIIDIPFPLNLNDFPEWSNSKKCNHLLVIKEQGIGDQLLFSSILYEVNKYVKKITVIVDKRLVTLLQRSIPFVTFISEIDDTTKTTVDMQIRMGDLPRVIGYDPEFDSKGRKPYLYADHELSIQFRKNTLVGNGKLCGLSWKSVAPSGSDKSISLFNLKKLFYLNEINYVNLQYGEISEDLTSLQEFKNKLTQVSNLDLYENIDGLASLIQACDLIVTTSNVTAHLAGALGKKTFLLVPYSKGRIWYWHSERRSTWYPSITQFFQDENLNWETAINSIYDELYVR